MARIAFLGAGNMARGWGSLNQTKIIDALR